MYSKEKFINVARKIQAWALSEGAPEDLNCWCAICSFKLFKRLKHLRPIFCATYNNRLQISHCFLECEDFIIDVTASQFLPSSQLYKIFCFPTYPYQDQNHKHWFWDYENMDFRSTKEYDIDHYMKRWPDDQNPFKYNQLFFPKEGIDV